jgi:hypothetical protein
MIFLLNGEMLRTIQRLEKLLWKSAFVPLVLLSSIEMLVRGVLSLIGLPVACILESCGEEYWAERITLWTGVGAIISFGAAIGSLIGLVENFQEDDLDIVWGSKEGVIPRLIACPWAKP